MTQRTRRTRAAAAALLIALAPGCGHEEPKSPPPASVRHAVTEAELATLELTEQAEARLGVATAPVERQTLPRTRTLGGETLAPPGRQLTVAAPFAGTVLAASAGGGSVPDAADGPSAARSREPSVGVTLAAGASVFRLVPLLAGQGDLAVETTRNLAAARARLAAARERAARAQQMLEDRAGSVRALEEARAELAVARADLAAAEARAALAGRTPSQAKGGLVLAAPREALLQSVFVSEGQTVAAGAPLFELVSLDPLWVRVPVFVGDLERIDHTLPARLRRLGSPPDAPALLAQPVPAALGANPASASADLLYELANPDGALRTGERVSVEVPLVGADEARVVPAAAILYDVLGGTWVYETSEPRIYRRRRVEVSTLGDGVAVLSRGPEAGVRVVTDGAAELFGAEFGFGK